MKTKNLLLSMFAVGVILMSGCKKAETTTDPGGGSLKTGQCKMSFKASGATTSNFTSDISMSKAIATAYAITMVGSAKNGTTSENFMIFLPTDIAVGTYASNAIPAIDFLASYAKGEPAWGSFHDKLFTLVVTKNADKSIEGTFSGILAKTAFDEQVNDVTFTEGKFAAKY